MTSSRKISIVPILWSRKNKNGEFPLKVRVTINRKSKYHPLGVYLKKSDWSVTRKLVKSSHPDFQRINYSLENLMKQIEQNLEQDEVKGSGRETSLIISFTDFVRQKIKREKYYNSKRYNTFLRHMIQFWGNENIQFYDLNSEFVLDFRNYLENNIDSRGFTGPSVNTVNNYLKTFRTLINKSIDDGVFRGQNPFKRGHIPDKKRTTKVTLNSEDMWYLNMMDENMEGMTKGMWDAKNVFLFSFWSQGIRIGDALQLRYGNYQDGFFVIKTQKNDVFLRFPVTESNVSRLIEYIPGVPSFFDWTEKLYYSANPFHVGDEIFKFNTKFDPSNKSESELLGTHVNLQSNKIRLFQELKGQLPHFNEKLQELDRVKFYFDDRFKLYSKEFYQKVKERNNPIDLHWMNLYEESKRLYLRVCMNFFIDFASKSKNKEGYVFPFLRGLEKSENNNVKWNKISSSTALINKNLSKISENFKLKKFSTHFARHTFTSLSKEMGTDIYDLKRWLGHSSVKVTEGYINTIDTSGSEKHTQKMKTYLGW
jgi:integrase